MNSIEPLESIGEEMESEAADKRLLEEVKLLLNDSLKRKEGIYQLANYIINRLHIITLRENDSIFIYNSGVYEPYGEKEISKYAQSELKLGNLISNHVINELYGYIRRSTYHKRENLQEPSDKICLQNGILDLNTMETQGHDPSIIFFSKLPVIYNKGASCLIIKKFLKEVLSDEDIVVIQEFVGYCLYKSYPIQKMFMLVGGGANGKSTLINLLKALFGQQNCSAIPLQQLEGNRFAVSNLFGKLANLFADLSASTLKDTSYLKMLTGEDLISAEKKFKDNFTFVNYAKMIFSCNQIPRSPDDSDAFFRRWVIINFPNQFLQGKADKGLIKKITTPEELSGLLNFAIDGLKRLLAQGDFSNAKSIEETRELYIRQSDSVGAFIMDCVQSSPGNFVKKNELYTTYCDYCRSMNYPITPSNKFHGQLQHEVRVEETRPDLWVDGKKQRVQCWKGIKVNVIPVNDVRVNSLFNPKNNNLLEPQFKYTKSPDIVDIPDASFQNKLENDTISPKDIKYHLERFGENGIMAIEPVLDDLSITEDILQNYITKGLFFSPVAGKIKTL